MPSVALASTGSFADRVTELLERVDYRRAESIEDREAIFRLRYDEYLREGAIAPGFIKRLTDRFDDEAWIFGVHVDGKLASSIRINVISDGRGDLPALRSFSDILLPQIAARKTVVDPSRLVTDQAWSRAYPQLPYVTTRLFWLAAEFFNAELLLGTVRVEHQAFYKRIYGFSTVCGARPYLTLIKPLSLIMVDFPATRDQVKRRYPFLRSTFFERRMLFERPARMAQRVAA